MLGKLIKFDLKSGARIFFLLHGILFAAALAGRFAFMDQLDFNEVTPALVSSIILFSSVMLFLLIAVCFCTWLLIAVRFYRSLFSGEGYLTWTLPASAVQHLWSKIISGIIWYVLDCIIISAAVLILVTGRNVTEAYSMIEPEVTAELGISLGSFGLWLFVLMIISCFSSVITTYFCVTVGQLFPAHRVLCAVAVYFISGLIVQFQHIARLDDKNILFWNTKRLCDLRICLQVTVLAVHRDGVFRLHKGIDQLQLLLTGMS